MWRQKPDCVGSDNSDAVHGSSSQHPFPQAVFAADPGCDDHHGSTTGGPNFRDQVRDGVRRGCNHTQIRDDRHIGNTGKAGQTAQLTVFRIDRVHRPAKSA